MQRIFFLIILLSLTLAALAQVPQLINYQGKLLKPDGTPVADGPYAMTFAIYAQPTGGVALWSEPQTAVQVKKGLFSVLLGSVNNLPANIFASPDRFFGVTVGTDPEMTPRQQITTAAYAFKAAVADKATEADKATTADKAAIADKAATADKATSADTVADGAITTVKIADAAVFGTKIKDGSIDTTKLAPPEDWKTAVLLNNWNVLTTGNMCPNVCFYKDALGCVHLQGVVYGGVSNTTALILPPGYRPKYRLLMSASACNMNAGSSYGCVVDIRTDGQVLPCPLDNNSWVSLSSIIFRAAQ